MLGDTGLDGTEGLYTREGAGSVSLLQKEEDVDEVTVALVTVETGDSVDDDSKDSLSCSGK